MRAFIFVGLVVSLLGSAAGFPARGLEKKGGWCETGKSRAAGSYVRCCLIEMGRALRFGRAPVLGRCERRFSKRWAEIGARRGRSCVASGGREGVQAVLDAAAGQVAAMIGGVSPTPTAAATVTVAATGTATGTATAAPATPTRTATATETRTPTATATLTTTQTSPPTPTRTPTAVPPTATASGTATATATSAPTPHLLVSEIAVSPSGAEFVEIYNPGGPADLSDVYLADYKSYYLITTGSGSPLSSDFRLQFPPGTVIGAAGYLVVSLESASSFQSVYGISPDFDLDASDAGAPAMLGSFKSPSGLTDSHEMVVLFAWDGASDLVEDLDYLVYGDASQAMDKTGVVVGTSAYAADTDPSLQDYAPAPSSGSSLCRIDATEGTEATAAGGNGISGHDETSENFATTFSIQTPPSPGGPCT